MCAVACERYVCVRHSLSSRWLRSSSTGAVRAMKPARRNSWGWSRVRCATGYWGLGRRDCCCCSAPPGGTRSCRRASDRGGHQPSVAGGPVRGRTARPVDLLGGGSAARSKRPVGALDTGTSCDACRSGHCTPGWLTSAAPFWPRTASGPWRPPRRSFALRRPDRCLHPDRAARSLAARDTALCTRLPAPCTAGSRRIRRRAGFVARPSPW